MSTPEVDALIVENLADLDAAVKHLTRIEGEVFSAIDKLVTRWAKDNGWKSNFNYLEEEAWIAHSSWISKDGEDDEFQARLWLDVGIGDTQEGEPNEDWYYLTRLCGAGVGQIGFRFSQEILKASKYKKMVKDVARLAQATAFTAEEKGSFYMPIKLDITTLAAAIRNEAIGDALGPVRQALDNVASAKPAFDKIIATLTTEA